MNTHSNKQHLPHDHPIHQNFKNGMAIVNTTYYFFTLPNTLDDHNYVHLVQQDTCLYDLQDLEPEELTERKRNKKNQARRRKMRRIRKRAEKLVQLKRELWLIHKWSRMEDGTMGIVWWNREYWDTGMGLKRLRTMENGLRIKKEEPLTPSLHIKVKLPPTPCLHYPSSSMSSSHFCSIDLNKFVWSPIYCFPRVHPSLDLPGWTTRLCTAMDELCVYGMNRVRVGWVGAYSSTLGCTATDE